MSSKREKGELSKYTKKERLLIDREIDNLEKDFSGIVSMKELPGAVLLVDSKKEYIALEEARKIGVPVVAICGSDCDIKLVNYPVPANESSKQSISFLVKELLSAYQQGAQELKASTRK